ncbi:CHAT domain-containing protein [Suillus paluster]|uniref:CHAT domain-containing protein n=1 Tax=Suillus paluster TaxID=48578 RepID=UPI001B882C55|nr:CHAT domain-containing protein [Suillus paluster]KAG1740421.1 CHAT domain-containing protein [Suillus paluster]
MPGSGEGRKCRCRCRLQHPLNAHPFLLSLAPELQVHPQPLLVPPLSSSSMHRAACHLLDNAIIPGSWKVIRGHNLSVPSERIPAGIYVSIKLNERRGWKSAIRVLLSDCSVPWSDTVTLSPDVSPSLSLEIWASFELGRMLGQGELIGKLETSWDELLDHGDEPFDLSFPLIQGVCPSLTLKTSVHPCGNDDGGQFDSIIDYEIARYTNVGHTRFAEYITSKTVSRLNNAVEQFQLVLDQCPAGHLDHAAAVTNLARARLQGYIQNDLQDIDSTISLFRDALALHPQGHPDCPLSLYHLTKALIWRHHNQPTPADICESARLYHELLHLSPGGTYLRNIAAGEDDVDYVINECDKLPTDGSDEDIQLRRIILELCPLGHQHHLNALEKLSQALGASFEQCGNIDDLDERIQCCRELVSLAPKGCHGRDTYLNNLAFSIARRFDHQGKSHDLNEAISLYEEALRLRPVGHRYRDFSLDNLGAALCTRFEKHPSHYIHDVNRAISLYREALILRPPWHPCRGTILANIASALKTRYDKSHASGDLNEAIDWYRESLWLMQHDHPERHRILHNLSSALCSRFTQGWKNEDVEEAIILCQQSLTALPPLHPDRFYSYRWLQRAYASRYRAQHKPADLSLAMANFKLASRHPTKGFPHRIEGAFHWVDEAEAYYHESALEAYATFFELLDAHLATRSSTIYKCLFDSQASTVSTDRAAIDWAATAYRRLLTRWKAAVAEIRNIHGFSQFLLPPSYKELQVAARHGPVIILIASKYSCDALIVPMSGQPHHVPFPSLSLAHLEMLKDDFAREIRHTGLMGPTEPRKDLRVLLRKLWDEIMQPIVNVLQHKLGLQPQSRIWLCPTAAFTSLPLHAANPCQKKPGRSEPEPCLEDLYVCSYMLTLSALIRSQQTMKMRATPSFMAIGQGTVLADVDNELKLVHALIPSNVKFTNLSGGNATRAGALDALQRNTWVHLACHGKQDRQQPYHSCFAMRDEPLTLLDIMQNDAPQAEFAFLLACHTTIGDEKMPDEVIHLAAGLQFSGFKSVIGTLWAVDDAVAKHIVEGFYHNMFKDLEDGSDMTV